MGEYKRTFIKKLSIRGYRNVGELELDDLPPVVVLCGPNGAGKSNILSAVRLLLQTLQKCGFDARGRKGAGFLPMTAKEELGFDTGRDFTLGGGPEVRVGLEVVLGDRAAEVMGAPLFSVLRLGGTFRLRGERTNWLNVCGVQVKTDGWDVGEGNFARRVFAVLLPMLCRGLTVCAHREYVGYRDRERSLRAAPDLWRSLGLKDTDVPFEGMGRGQQEELYMLHACVGPSDPILYLEEPEAHLHKNSMEALAAFLWGSVYGEGDGNNPTIDQLWITTHHRYFLLADEFFDVSSDSEGKTKVVRRPRDEAAIHFYEPSPYLDTLKALVRSGLSPETVMLRDESGDVRARDVLESMDGDQKLAMQFANAATKAFVLSLVEENNR